MSVLPPKPKLSNRALARKLIIHVGYELQITPEIKSQLNDLAEIKIHEDANKKILSKPIVAVMYQDSQSKMEMWHKTKKTTTGLIHGLFHDSDGKYLVLRITIHGQPYWVTLFKGTDIAPINLKRKVAMGELGPEIMLSSKIPVQCVPYVFHSNFDKYIAK